MKKIKSVAVIGIGVMGAPIARRIRDAGYALTVCDRNTAATAPFVEAGAKVVNSPAECRECDLVIVLVATAEQLRDVLLGEAGIATVGGGQTLVAVMSTVGPDVIEEMRDASTPHGLYVFDAPVSGGVVRAELGELSIFVGADQEAFEATEPVLRSFGQQIFHLGDVGAGQSMKIVNNAVGVMNFLMAAEAYSLGIAKGLSIENIVRAIDASSGRNFLSVDPVETVDTFRSYARAVDSGAGPLAIMRKDAILATELAETLGLELPVLHGLREIVDRLTPQVSDTWRMIGEQRL